MQQLADQANAYAVLVQTKIAQKSLDAAQQSLNNPFAKALLPQEIRQKLMSQVLIQKQQFQHASAQRRIKIKFWVIFIILCAVGGYLILKKGAISTALNILGIVTRCARIIIGAILVTLLGSIGAGLSYLVSIATSALGILS